MFAGRVKDIYLKLMLQKIYISFVRKPTNPKRTTIITKI
jgi:hypothetical protein